MDDIVFILTMTVELLVKLRGKPMVSAYSLSYPFIFFWAFFIQDNEHQVET